MSDIDQLLAFLSHQKDPLLAIIQAGYARGIFHERTAAEWAKTLGVSRQWFYKGVSEYAKEFGITKEVDQKKA